MQDLLREYKETRRRLKRAYDARREGEKVLDDRALAERQILSEMIGEVEWIIEWLETGRRPGNRRGIERRAAYERERPIDPVRLQAYAAKSTAGSPCNLTEWERFRIEEALSRLSARERECYELHYGMCFSLGEIADLLQIKKGTVQYYIESAENKIKDAKLNSLFLVAG